MEIFLLFYLTVFQFSLPLHRVFHSIRFKVYAGRSTAVLLFYAFTQNHLAFLFTFLFAPDSKSTARTLIQSHCLCELNSDCPFLFLAAYFV